MTEYKNRVCKLTSECCLIGFVFQAIPDTKLTIKKYADAKFEYLVSSPKNKLQYC